VTPGYTYYDNHNGDSILLVFPKVDLSLETSQMDDTKYKETQTDNLNDFTNLQYMYNRYSYHCDAMRSRGVMSGELDLIVVFYIEVIFTLSSMKRRKH